MRRVLDDGTVEETHVRWQLTGLQPATYVVSRITTRTERLAGPFSTKAQAEKWMVGNAFADKGFAGFSAGWPPGSGPESPSWPFWLERDVTIERFAGRGVDGRAYLLDPPVFLAAGWWEVTVDEEAMTFHPVGGEEDDGDPIRTRWSEIGQDAYTQSDDRRNGG